MLSNDDLLSHYPSLCLALPEETCTPEIGSFQSCCILSGKRLCFGLLYFQHSSTNFDNFFVDNKDILLGTVWKY